MNEIPTTGRWRRRARRTAVVLVLFLLALLALRTVSNVWITRQLNAEIGRLERQYGRLVPATASTSVADWGRNRARAFVAAAMLLPDCRELLGKSGSRPSEIVWIAHEADRPAVEAALLAAERPLVAWDLSGEPPLLALRCLGTSLAVTATHEAAQGHADQAVKVIAAGLSEAAALREGEPTLIMALVGLAAQSTQLNALKSIMATSSPSADALAGLAHALEETRAHSSMQPAMIGELKYSRDRWRRIEGGETYPDAPGIEPLWLGATSWLARPLLRHVERGDLEDHVRAIDLAGMPRSARAGVTTPPPAPVPEGPWWSPGRQLALLRIPGLSRSLFQAIQSGDEGLAMLNAATTAVALRRCHLDRGAYPTSLDALVPAYLSAVPVDPFTGRPIEYAREGEGFLVRADLPVAKRALAEWKLAR